MVWNCVGVVVWLGVGVGLGWAGAKLSCLIRAWFGIRLAFVWDWAGFVRVAFGLFFWLGWNSVWGEGGGSVGLD